MRPFVALVRGYRQALRGRAAKAAAENRPDYALAVWHVLQDLDAGLRFLEHLTRRKEP